LLVVDQEEESAEAEEQAVFVTQHQENLLVAELRQNQL
tara:strand:- start:648 stop:761 length:114 start_codon:yes stop_codon:yes gene_type:complete